MNFTDILTAELVIPMWVIVPVTAVIVMLIIIALIYATRSRKHRRISRHLNELVAEKTDKIAALHVSIQNYRNGISDAHNAYEKVNDELRRLETTYEARIKSLNERLCRATEENRRIAVDQAKNVFNALPDNTDFHHTYREIYRFLVGKA